MKRRYDCHPICAVEAALELIGGKWKAVILYHLIEDKKRFNELRRLIPSVTQRMITRQLRELEAAGLINRTVYTEIPPKVEYELSALGLTLKPVLQQLRQWGAEYGKQIMAKLEHD